MEDRGRERAHCVLRPVVRTRSFDERHDVGGSSARPASRTWSTTARRLAALGTTSGLLFLAACSSQDTAALKRLGLPEAATDRAPAIANLWIGSWIAAGIVGLTVWGLIGYVVLRFRSDNNEMPKQNRYNLPMEIFYTTAPFVIIGVLFYYTILAQNTVTAKGGVPDVTVDVVAQKWSWSFNYREADNPAVGQNVYEVGTITATPDLYLPVNQKVTFNLNSVDVNHGFWVPAFYEKMDVIPGRNNNFQATPNKEGVYRGKCTELCGTYHQAMLFNVHVVSEADYNNYLKTLAAKGQVGEIRGPANADPQGTAKIYQGEEVGDR
jgi:cytochrome c oxidase subunit 2